MHHPSAITERGIAIPAGHARGSSPKTRQIEVTLARKEAEAMAIRRREETAQARQLANTARLLENNPVLLRLKELEGLADLASRIDRLTVVGGGDLVKPALLSELARAVEDPEEG